MKISNIGIRKFIKDNAPTILSYLAVAGVIGTSVEISKASVKANKKIKEYREKLIELHGTEEDEKIRSEIVRSRTVIASAKPDVRWRREGRSEMTNGEILNKKIADEGITVTFKEVNR